MREFGTKWLNGFEELWLAPGNGAGTQQIVAELTKMIVAIAAIQWSNSATSFLIQKWWG